MPGWHEATKALQESGEINVAGIIQEQHPDRCALFMQWHEMDWPIMVDSLDLLGVSAVPITVLIDEAGVVYKYRARTRDLADFLNEPTAEAEVPPPTQSPDLEESRAHTRENDAKIFRRFADQAYLWERQDKLDWAIDTYRKSLNKWDSDVTHFHLGVALLSRYEQNHDPADFAAAIESWSTALAMNPNQYIWRRRIQQYGPRLDKPYSFYDWVSQAREEIIARGDEPSPLLVEPRGAELAYPAREFSTEETQPTETDPDGRINRDERTLVDIKSVVVPTTKKDGGSSRIHVLFTPSEAKLAHWNNEVDGLEVWIVPPNGWDIDRQRVVLENPPIDVSREVRNIEFEIRKPAEAEPGEATVQGYALYYVCEDADGECLYLRQDFEIKIAG